MCAATADRAVDPRVSRSKQLILHAALAELGEVGYGAFSIESVASRARVGKSTIYRHWSDKLSLIADAFGTLHEQEAPDIQNGTVRERIERVLRHVAEVVRDSPFSACMPAMIDAAERDSSLRRFHHEFQRQAREPLIELIAAGQRLGELPTSLDPQLIAFALLGAIFFQRLMTATPFDPERIDALVTNVLDLAA